MPTKSIANNLIFRLIKPRTQCTRVICELINAKRQIHAHSFAIGFCTVAAIAQGKMVVLRPGSYRIRFGLGLCLGNQLAEGGQGSELAGSEEVVVMIHAKGGRTKPPRIFRKRTCWTVFRLFYFCG